MSAPKEVIRLVETFRNNIHSLKSENYNETQVRREYIDPLFEALGWDVFNENSYAEAYKDVVHEYSQKTSDTTKNPDYCFRIGGKRKFFVEAKKPSINLKDDIHPAYQLRRYGWSAKLPLSILTDFEEFAVYDCRILPKKNDKASTARIMFLTFEDYLEKWDELIEIFSKESILKGSFDKYAESNKKKRGTADVDEAFLNEMEGWRNLLARNIALRNSTLSIRELNFSVQKTIDRIIFLRICEDRGIENYGQLLNLLNGTNVYERLKQIFTRADEKYNSGLFHFEKEKDRNDIPDEITPSLQIDDKTLKDIIKNLYYPESPYEFSVLPADILGHVYEQFLGKVIRLTPAHFAVVEDKPEVKKAGGVYYTPTYIVEYIVKNTVGKILENKTLNEISKIRILDPACGSGSFLLGAFQYLLDYHLDFYTKNKEQIADSLKKKQPPIYQIRKDEYKLTTIERKRILLNNIYGVDIDSQAVEVTKLSLLLKVLEGESEETLTSQMKMFRERALPDLANNIKCGNSLIGPDFYDQMEMNFLNDEEKLKINIFDWKSEFKEIMYTGGFDAVIGNPPYVSYEKLDASLKNYTINNYKSFVNNFDAYQIFLEKSSCLIKDKGFLSFIIPNLFLKGMNYKLTRKYFYDNFRIEVIRNYGDGVFRYVQMPTCIIVFSKNKKDENNIKYFIKRNNEFDSLSVKQENFNNDNYLFFYNPIISKIKNKNITLKKIINITRGLEIGKDKIIDRNSESIEILFGKDISRYSIKEISHISIDTYNSFSKNKSIFSDNKIIVRETGERINATLDQNGYLTNRSLYCIKSDEIPLPSLLGILNSKLIQYYYINEFRSNTNIFPKIRIGQVQEIPIIKPDISFNKKTTSLVLNIINLFNKLCLVKTPTEKTSLQRQIDATDKQIDQLVYKLYGLTEEEIKIVEGK